MREHWCIIVNLIEMLKKIIFIVAACVALNVSAKITCYIKIGFGDCINCFNVLALLSDFDKVYVFKEEYKGLEKEILNEYFGIINNPTIHTSDSFYSTFGYKNFTVISIRNNFTSKELLKFPMSKFDEKRDSLRIIKTLINQNSTFKINLNNNWHSQCELKLSENNEVLIFDPILRKLKRFSKNMTLKNSFSIDTQFIKQVYNRKFNDNNAKLNELKSLASHLGINNSFISFNNFTISQNYTYLLISSKYFDFKGKDTFYTNFYSVIKFDQKFKYEILNVTPEVGEKLYVNSNFLSAINDSTLLLDLVTLDPRNEPFILSVQSVHDKNIKLTRILPDSIPLKSVDRKLFYRVTSFRYDSGYVAYEFFNSVFYENKALPNLKLFNNPTNESNFLELTNCITGVKKINQWLYISYGLDSMYNVSKYNLIEQKLSPPIFSLKQNKMSTFLQLDKRGVCYYVDTEKNLNIVEL